MPTRRHKANIFLHSKFNLQALLHLAERLRNRPCTCDPSQKPKSGSLNWTIVLSFDDGEEWLFRSPRTYYGIDEDVAELLLASEAATLKYIRKNSSIPVPDIFHYSPTRSNEIGVPYILMSKARGFPLSTRIWQTHADRVPNTSANPRRRFTNEEKEKIMKQLGAIVSQLSRLRLDKIGSLFEEQGCYTVKACLSPGHLLHERHTLREICRGPFYNEGDYFRSLLSAFLLHIQCLPMDHHIFFAPVPVPHEYQSYASYLSATDRWNDFVVVGSKTDSSKNHLYYFVAGQFLERMIPSFTSECCAFTNRSGYPIHHADLSSNNIFVDDDCNIPYIIDWAFASSVPFVELLTTPGLLHPRDRPEPSLVASFKAGFTKHFETKDEVIHPSFWEAAEKVWHFIRLVNMDALQDYGHFSELHALLVGNLNADIPALFREQYGKKVISETAKRLAIDDMPQCDMERDEGNYFSNVEPERHGLSRKLTVASELSRRFAADRNYGSGLKTRWLLLEQSIVRRRSAVADASDDFHVAPSL
ncbi:hypothetical protein GQ44DRAFT_756462 [Phaeosphaeriaceae sp. PMI808]|nr:hypothetical protein GQ44DRAFT_756462 [Phaeosphaeriaceae sp. PMI808]